MCGKPVENLRSRVCSHTCQQESQYREYIARWKTGLETGNRGKGRQLQVSCHVRRFLFEKFGAKCARCGWDEINPTTGKIPLNVEHLDGNPHRTVEDNITLICPNCHALTPTFGNLNRGRGRESGPVAHLGERLAGSEEVAGSIPAGSTGMLGVTVRPFARGNG